MESMSDYAFYRTGKIEYTHVGNQSHPAAVQVFGFATELFFPSLKAVQFKKNERKTTFCKVGFHPESETLGAHA